MEGRRPLVAGLGELYVESLVGWVSFCVCVSILLGVLQPLLWPTDPF